MESGSASGGTPTEFEVLGRTPCHDGFFRVERLRLRFALFAGGWSRPIEREVLDRGHAACVLLYDAAADRVVLVEQFRAPVIDEPGGPWLIETVAGIIERGETPEDVIRREAVEEADITIGPIERIGEVLVSPGGCTERLTMFCGGVDSSAAGGLHGLAEEGEDIRVVVMDAGDAIKAVSDGLILAANAVIPLQWLTINHLRLRNEWRAEP